MKFADPTGMQIVTPADLPLTGPTGVVPQNGGGFGIVDKAWTYDYDSQSYIMSYGFSDFVVNGANNSNDYFVSHALSGNAAYASSVTADHKNAIDWQIANASAKAMEGVNIGNSIFQGAVSFASAFSESFVYGAERIVAEKGYLLDDLKKNVVLKEGGNMPKTDFVYGKGVGNFTRGMELLGGIAVIVQGLVSLSSITYAFYTQHSDRYKILVKSLVDIAVPAACLYFGGLILWIAGGAYFVIDMAGGWNYVWGIEQ